MELTPPQNPAPPRTTINSAPAPRYYIAPPPFESDSTIRAVWHCGALAGVMLGCAVFVLAWGIAARVHRAMLRARLRVLLWAIPRGHKRTASWAVRPWSRGPGRPRARGGEE